MIPEHTAEKISRLGIAAFAGWIACSAYYQIPKLWNERNQLTVERAVAKCERERANQSGALAADLLISNHLEHDLPLDFSMIPADDCHEVAKQIREAQAKKADPNAAASRARQSEDK